MLTCLRYRYKANNSISIPYRLGIYNIKIKRIKSDLEISDDDCMNEMNTAKLQDNCNMSKLTSIVRSYRHNL